MSYPKFRTGFLLRSIPVLLTLLAYTFLQAQWVRKIPPNHPATPKIFALLALGDTVIAGFESGIFRSLDNGGNWTQSNSGLPESPFIVAMAAQGPAVLAGILAKGLYQSSNRGLTWTKTALPVDHVISLAVEGDFIYAGTCCNGLYRSRDLGVSWTPVGLTGSHILSIAIRGSSIFASTPDGLFHSTHTEDGENTWTRIPAHSGLPDGQVNLVAVTDSSIYAATRAGLSRSSDNGLSWTRLGLADTLVLSLLVREDQVFAGTAQGLFRSQDRGDSWTGFKSGFGEEIRVLCLAIGVSHLFAGVPGDGVWIRALSDQDPSMALRPYPATKGRSGAGSGPGKAIRSRSGIGFSSYPHGSREALVYDIAGKALFEAGAPAPAR